MARKLRKKEAAEMLGKMVKTFGNTLGEIFDDPELRTSAKKFAESVVDAAAKVVQSRVEDDEVRAKFRSVGEAAQTLGKSLEEHFKD